MDSIAYSLFGTTRSRVLCQLLLHPEASLHVRELARATSASPGSLHRELRKLTALGLLTREPIGRQVHYRANISSPVFADLANLLRKTAGIADVLRDALAPLAGAVELAFVYGSVAAGTEHAGSDIDLMVLGNAGFAEVVHALATVSARLGREVNPTPMARAAFIEKLTAVDGFVTAVADGPRIWVRGGEHEFGELVAHRQRPSARAESGGDTTPAYGGSAQSE